MPSHIDTAIPTKAFDYPVAEHWGRNLNVQPCEDSNRQHIGSQSNALPTEPSWLRRIEVNVKLDLDGEGTVQDRFVNLLQKQKNDHDKSRERWMH